MSATIVEEKFLNQLCLWVIDPWTGRDEEGFWWDLEDGVWTRRDGRFFAESDRVEAVKWL